MEWFKMFWNGVPIQKLQNFHRELYADLSQQHLTYTNRLFSDHFRSVIFSYILIYEKNEPIQCTFKLAVK